MNEDVWIRKFTRERAARNEAEHLLETKSRDLFVANEQLRELATELRHENENTKAILDNAADGIVTFLGDGTITKVNVAAEEIFGIKAKDVIGHSFDRFFFDLELSDATLKSFNSNDQTHEYRGRGPNDTELVVEVACSRTGCEGVESYIAIIRDQTRKRAMTAQLALSQKMESVGQLAAGIAHEINTPVQYISDNTRFLQDAFTDLESLFHLYDELLGSCDVASDEIRAKIRNSVEELDISFLRNEIPLAVEQTLVGTDRVATIVRAMKDFSHPGGENPVALDLNRSLTSAITVSRNEWKYVADLETDFEENIPSVVCLAGEINQVFLNLIVNAAHAIEKRQTDSMAAFQGLIKLSTRKLSEHVEIEFADNGCGISDQCAQKMFDPFFTTKPVGKGTGQGLAIVHRIVVEHHSGEIKVDSKLGEGTQITVSIPLVQRNPTSTSTGGPHDS